MAILLLHLFQPVLTQEFGLVRLGAEEHDLAEGAGLFVLEARRLLAGADRGPDDRVFRLRVIGVLRFDCVFLPQEHSEPHRQALPFSSVFLNIDLPDEYCSLNECVYD